MHSAIKMTKLGLEHAGQSDVERFVDETVIIAFMVLLNHTEITTDI
jgi:hypothetical protein